MSRALVEEPQAKWTGRALTQDLAQSLRDSGWIAVSEMMLPGWDARVDVMAIKPHAFATQDLRIYEVKVSRQDFYRDERASKWRKYLDVAHRVLFACPAGLLGRDDVPKEAGLIVRGPNGWSVLKAPKGHYPPGLTVDVVMAMLFKVHNTDVEIRELKKRIATKENVELADAVHGLDYRIRERLRGRMSRDDERNLQSARRLVGTCGKVLGLDPEKEFYRIEAIICATARLLEHGDLYQRIASAIDDLGSSYCDTSAQLRNVRKLESDVKALANKGAMT